MVVTPHNADAHPSRSRRLRQRSANSYVRSQGTRQRLSVPTDSGSVSGNCNWLQMVGDGALRRRSIKLLFAGSAFRVSVSGLVLCLNGGRRAQPGHVVRDRGSPPWLHPRRCAALRFLLSTASTAGSSDGCDLSRAPRRSRPSRVSSGLQGGWATGYPTQVVGPMYAALGASPPELRELLLERLAAVGEGSCFRLGASPLSEGRASGAARPRR